LKVSILATSLTVKVMRRDFTNQKDFLKKFLKIEIVSYLELHHKEKMKK